jgi:hypothetical protein
MGLIDYLSTHMETTLNKSLRSQGHYFVTGDAEFGESSGYLTANTIENDLRFSDNW